MIVVLLLFLGSGLLTAQHTSSAKGKLRLLDMPKGILYHEISGRAIIARDSVGDFIMQADAPASSSKERFEFIMRPVAGIYFGKRRFQKVDNLPNQNFPVYTSLQTVPEISRNFIYRISESGSIIDSFQLNDERPEHSRNGVFCRIFNPFPKEEYCLLPPYGKPIKLPTSEQAADGSDNRLMNITCYNCPESKEEQVSIFAKPISVLDSLVDEGKDSYKIHRLSWEEAVVYSKVDPGNYRLGRLIAEFPAIHGRPATIWLQCKEGILHFQGNEAPVKHDQVFIKKNYHSGQSKFPTLIYSGKKGAYQLETPFSKTDLPILPDRTKFLFAWADGFMNPDYLNDKSSLDLVAASPEKRLLEEVNAKCRAEITYKPGMVWSCNGVFTRPELVFESNGSLFALDQSGKTWPLPPVKDTVLFLSRLRFQEGQMIWNDLLEPFRPLLPLLASPELSAERKKIRASYDLTNLDTSIEYLNTWFSLIKVPSLTLAEKYRAKASHSILVLVSGKLFTLDGKHIPLSGSIAKVQGYYKNQLILLIQTQGGYELRDAGNQLHLSCENIAPNFDEKKPFCCTYNNKYFCIIPGKEKLQVGTGWDHLFGLFEYKVDVPQYEVYKGQKVWVIPPFFGRNPEQTYYQAYCYGTKNGNSEQEEALLNGYGTVIFKGPFTKDDDIKSWIKIRLNGKKDSITTFNIEALVTDSCLASNPKKTFIFKDAEGVFFRIREKKTRLPFPEKYFITSDGTRFFFEKEGSWFSITETEGIRKTKLNLPAQHYLIFDYSEYKVLKSHRAGCNWLPGTFGQQKFLLNIRTGKVEYMKPHPSIAGVFRIPDSLRQQKKLKKWLVDEECWRKYLQYESANQNDFLLLDDEGISCLQKPEPLQKEDYMGFLKSCTWVSKKWNERKDSIQPICKLLRYPDLLLAKTPQGLRFFRRGPSEKLIPLEEFIENLYLDYNSKTFAIRRENGLFELFLFSSASNPLPVSLGMFRRTTASMEYHTGEIVLLVERTDGQIQGFTMSNEEMKAFWPDACLKKAFPHLPNFQAWNAPERMYHDELFIRLMDAGGGTPIGYYTRPTISSNRSEYQSGKSTLFNPLGITISPSVHNTLRRNNLAGFRVWEYPASGNSRTWKILPPPGFELYDPAANRKDRKDSPRDFDKPVKAVKLNDGKLDFLVWADSLSESGLPDRYWMFSALKNQIYPLENKVRPARLYFENSLTSSELENAFLFRNGKPMMLREIAGGIESISFEGKKPVASMYPWSGFIDKSGNQKISMACEGGACTSNSIRFKYGMASVCVNKRIRYIDENGINPFNLKFCCASEFFGDVGLVYGPRYVHKPAPGDPNFEIIQADKKTDVGYEYPEDKECEWMRGGNPSKYWISKNGRLRKAVVYDSTGKVVPDLRVCFKLDGNYACGTSGDALILFDTSGNLVAYLKDHEVDWDSEYNVVSNGMVRVKKSNSSGLKGFMNVKGELTVPVRFWEASHFSNGISLVKDDQNEAYYIDKKGNKKFPELAFFHFEAQPFSEGFAQVKLKNGTRIVLDSNGKIHPELNKGSLGKFRNGIAWFRDDSTKKYGYLNTRGKVLIKPQFDKAGEFSEGIATVKGANGAQWFIDVAGKRLAGFPEVLSADMFSGGLCYVTLPGDFKFEFDLDSGKMTPLITEPEPASFEEMRTNKYTLSSKSDSFSIWHRLNENSQLDYKILLH